MGGTSPNETGSLCILKMKKNKYKYNPLKGDRFNRLTFVEEIEPRIQKRKDREEVIRRCLVQCDCGNIIEKNLNNVVKGYVRSCGCYAKEKRSESNLGRYTINPNRGDIFNRWEFISETEPKIRERRNGDISRERRGLFRCNCGNEKILRLSSVISGQIKSCGCLAKEKSHNNKKNIVGVGVNDYDGLIREKGVEVRSYQVWRSMIARCYNPKVIEKRPKYADCKVCNEWKDYVAFKEWFDANYDEKIMKGYQLDKDLLIKGNKVYSPDTCCFVPIKINTLFTYSQRSRRGLPVGVVARGRRYSAHGRFDGNHISLGTYNNAELAFLAYKNKKEETIVKTANDYWVKGLITERVYKAMLNYKVEITD